MVWGLFPVESFPGAQKYYFFHRGTYKAGRRDCDVIIQNDKGVSRIHAELVVDAMTSWDPLNISSSFLSDVRIIDKSKYGTFINKEKGSKPLNEFPNKETTLKNGDLVSFGTGNAVFRFSFVPLIFFIHCAKSFQLDPSLQEVISSIGACITRDWNPSCTHVLVDESSSVSEELIDAIMAKKPVVTTDWVKVVAEKNIHTELPSFTDHIPKVTLEGISVKIVEPKDRENCLAGHTFVLGPSHLYKFGDRLKPLLEVCNAKILTVDEFSSTSQTSVDGANNPMVLVISAERVNEFNRFHHINSLSRVTDTKLVAAVLTGHFDSSVMESPSIAVSSSHSTDETIVADSDVEMDTATSDHIASGARSEAATRYEEKEVLLKNHEDGTSDKMNISSFKVEEGGLIERKHKGDESITSENQNSDIIYSQDLIVRNAVSSSLNHSLKKNIVNFKCFRKRETPSGNSFKDLIPFSKYPHKESDCGSEVTEYVIKEKKRKQMEAVAEDLFNSEKVKRHGAARSSLRDLFARH
ncbi:hypothetical protein MRB53_033767 [Persea americana]|uniref:Uncharacterized protein n=1 Tax=Persea americana TaxID=3435 RepID=A0ACC2KVY1_PERAE|nr:hypothetical protein MRB53_033767 [Persea americana]|eukprot:TRINITY_DN23305_c0_g1_i3.p1 TRINITY_DN23305_c0_g1~~TRINITY_DN23305_c0_g1_i3.p1  ORF type:complete len:524 (-),score=112.00 TRINITY_DN23305_c0_g1_i3:191-1762(-)